MTRREIERLASAVNNISAALKNGDDEFARISLTIGRAVLPKGSAAAWKKWLLATGWPKLVAGEMAQIEAER